MPNKILEQRWQDPNSNDINWCFHASPSLLVLGFHSKAGIWNHWSRCCQRYHSILGLGYQLNLHFMFTRPQESRIPAGQENVPRLMAVLEAGHTRCVNADLRYLWKPPDKYPCRVDQCQMLGSLIHRVQHYGDPLHASHGS